MQNQNAARTAPKRKLPYLTEEDLNAPVKAVLIKVYGKYTKRGEQRKDVYEDDYEAEIEVPARYAMGHVKLGINRYIKKELKGIRARTFEVDTSFNPVPVKEKRIVKDFMSQQGLMDNDSVKRLYHERLQRARLEQQAKQDGTWVPPAFSDTTNYGDDGLPPLAREPQIEGE